MPRYTSIGQHFWVMFSLLVVVISAVTALGVYGMATSIRRAVVHGELQREAAYFAQRSAANPQAQLPDTWLVRGYLAAGDANGSGVPAAMRKLGPGYHTVLLHGGITGTVYVSDTPRGRLYLRFNDEGPTRIVMMLGLASVVLMVLVIYLATYLTYRASRKAVKPVITLARVVRGWNPNQPDPESLSPDRLPATIDSDVETLASALYNFANRLQAFVERERNFTRDASHELRTPLTVMKIAADVLADEEMSPFARRALARTRRAVREMEALIETFLVLARESDTGLRNEDFLANEVVRVEAARYRELLGVKPVELVVIEHARFALHAPPRVFAVMVGNLIRNACLYTEHGSVTVTVEADKVRVVDTGSGMSKDDLERAFQSFYRGGRTGGRGHGIGLAIVRRIADRYGWQVTLESTLGVGTTAIAHFPAARPPDAALPEPEPQAESTIDGKA